MLERIKKDDLPKDTDVDCRAVRPLLPLVADPLELTSPPRRLSEHIGFCRRCQGELENLEELKHVIIIAEVPILREKVIADATTEFMEKVYKLRGIPPEAIDCEQTKPHYIDMANCSLQVPPEIYRHTRHCNSCKEQVKQLRDRLRISFGDALGRK